MDLHTTSRSKVQDSKQYPYNHLPQQPPDYLTFGVPVHIYDIMYAIAAKDGTMEIRHITT